MAAAAGGIPALKIRDSVAEDQLVGGEGLVVCLRKDTGEEMVVPRDVLSHREELPPGGGVDDLTQLAFLNEASILDNLQERYTQGEDRARRPRIYTYCGRILLAANPFQPMPELYTLDVMQRYHQAARFEENPPHLFAIAAAAFSAMMHRHAGVCLDQSILISGESGAGKTESAKLIMDYLATVSASADALAAEHTQSTVSDSAEQAERERQSHKLHKLFEAIDVDGSGSLDAAEIGRLCEAMGSSLSAAELEQAMKAIDTDHNGGINFEEFAAWRTKLQGRAALPVNADQDATSRTGAPTGCATSSVARSVVQTNPLLEAFGNAHTLRNANSSRFGKMTRILFNARGAIIGARTDVYLLEKSRVCRQAVGERNFHIFYQLLAGADDTTLDGLGLVGVRSVVAGQAVRKFKALTPGATSSTHQGQIKVGGADVNRRLQMTKKFTQLRADLNSSDRQEDEKNTDGGDSKTSVNEDSEGGLADGIDDASAFRVVCDAMQAVGIGSEERMCFLRVVAAVLLLGEITFETDTGRSGEEIATLAAPRRGDLSSSSLSTVAMLLSIDPDELAAVLLSRTSRAGTEQLVIQLGPQAAVEARDALAKSLYAHLFRILVARVNVNNGGTEHSASSIGVLDIFGFECFASNSLEQLLINYANEKLQQQFTWYVFTLEQEEYVREGISFDAVEHQDNSPILELLEGAGGVLALVEEECRMQRGTDSNFMQKLKQFPAPTVEVHLRKPGATPETTVTFPRLQNDLFTVRHYAGEVTYTARGFRDKSMDHVHMGATTMVCNSTDPFVANLFADVETTVESPEMTPLKSRSIFGGKSTPSKSTPSKANRRTLSIGMQFKAQLGGLVDEINCTQAHYVRCIKPNDSSAPNDWAASSVLEQLRSQGILEAIRIARAMFPNRMKHLDFISAYSICLRDAAGGGIGNASQLWSAAHVERLLQPAPVEPEPEPINAFDVFSAIEEIDSDEDEPSQEPTPEPTKKSGFGFGGIFSGSRKSKDKEKEKEAQEKQRENARELAEMEKSKAARLLELLETFDEDQAVLGHSKVFLRSEAFEVLESRRQRVQSLFALRLQAAARGFLARARCRRLRTAALTLQAVCRSGMACKRFLATRKAAVCLQAFRRGAKGRQALRELHMNRSATMIAANARAWRARVQYGALKRASLTAQKSARCKLAQLRYTRLRDEARESARLEGRLATVESEFASLSDENARLQQELVQATAKARAEANNELEKELQQYQKAAADAENKSAAAERQVTTFKLELEQEQQISQTKLEQAQARADAALQLATDDASEARDALSKLQEQVQAETAAREEELVALREQANDLEAKRQQAAADAMERFAAGEQAQKAIDMKEQTEYVDELLSRFDVERADLEGQCKALQHAAAVKESDLVGARENLQSAEASIADQVSRLQLELEASSEALTEAKSSRKADQLKFMTAMQATEKRFAESQAEATAVAEAKAESASKAAEAERVAIAAELEASVAELRQVRELSSSEHETIAASFAQERQKMESALKDAQDAQTAAEKSLADSTRDEQQNVRQWQEEREKAEEQLKKTVAEIREAEAALVAERLAAQNTLEKHENAIKGMQNNIDSLHEEATARQEQYAARQEERERVDAEKTAAHNAQIAKLESDATVALASVKATEQRLHKENVSLSEQLESLQSSVAAEAEGTSDMVQQVQLQLRQMKEERDDLARQLVQQHAELTTLQNEAEASADAAAQKLASSIAAEREALTVTHRQEVELLKLEASADAEDLRNQLAISTDEVERLRNQIENMASTTEKNDDTHRQELTDMQTRAEQAESRLQELQAVAQMEEGAAAEQEAAAEEKQKQLETELQQLQDKNAVLEEKLLVAQQREAEDHVMLSQKLDSALTAVRHQAEEAEAAEVRHTADKEAALAAAAAAHAAAVEQVRVEAAEAAIASGVELHYELDKAAADTIGLRTELNEVQQQAQAAHTQVQQRLETSESATAELVVQHDVLQSTIENLRLQLKQQHVEAQQAAHAAAEAYAAELQVAVTSATQAASRALRSKAEAEVTEALEIRVSELTSELEAQRTAMADAEAAREAETLMLEAQGEARMIAERRVAEEVAEMATTLRNAQEDATTARAAAKQGEILAAEAAKSLANVEEERNAALTSLNQLSNARKAEVMTAAEELRTLREALSRAEEKASAAAAESLLPPPSPGPPPEMVQTISILKADVASAEAKATDAATELKQLRKDKVAARDSVQALEAQVVRLTEELRCARAAVQASEEADAELKERQMKVKYMKENEELARTAREATERATRLEGVVRKYRLAAEDAAAQLREQAESEEGRIQMRRELRESPAAKRPSSIPRVSKLVEQRQRLQREADGAAEIIARGQEAREQYWSALAKPVRTMSPARSGSKTRRRPNSPPTTPMREHSPTERNQSGSPMHNKKKKHEKRTKNAGRVPRKDRWDHPGTPATVAMSSDEKTDSKAKKKGPKKSSTEDQQASLETRIAELQAQLGLAAEKQPEHIGSGLPPGTPPRTPNQIGGADREHSPRFVALRRSLTKQIESSGQKSSTPASHGEAVEAANQLRQAIASGDPADVAASAAAIRESSSAIIERATRIGSPPPDPVAAGTTVDKPLKEISKVERTLLEAELEVAKGELLSLLAAPGNTHRKTASRRQPLPRRTLATNADATIEGASSSDGEDGDVDMENTREEGHECSDDDNPADGEEPLFERGAEYSSECFSGVDADSAVENGTADKENEASASETDSEDDDEERKGFFERYAEDNARRRWHRKQLNEARAEEEQAETRWKSKASKRVRKDSDQTWNKVREAQQLKRAYLEERRRRAEQAELEMCRKTPLTKKSRELADKVAARRGSFIEREAQFAAERARKLEMKKREKEQAEYQQRPIQREIDKEQADGFVARQLAWESKVEAKRAVKKEEMEETMLANLRDRPEVDAKSLEIAKEIGWNPDHKSFFKAQMAWNSHREADRSAKQTHAAMMEAADLRSRPELSKESRKLAQLAARSAGVEGVDVTQRLLAPSSTRRSAHASSASGARSAGGNDWSAPAADFRPQISAASIAMVERRSELEAAAGVPRADCLSRLYPSADQPRTSRLSVAGGYDARDDRRDGLVETGSM